MVSIPFSLLSSMPNYGKSLSQMIKTLRAQSFTSLKADLHQDINGGFVFRRCHFGIFPLTQKRRFVFVTFLIWVNVPMS